VLCHGSPNISRNVTMNLTRRMKVDFCLICRPLSCLTRQKHYFGLDSFYIQLSSFSRCIFMAPDIKVSFLDVMSPGVAVVAMLAGGFKPVPQSRRHRLARYSHIDGDGVYGDDVQLREPTCRKTRKLRRSFSILNSQPLLRIMKKENLNALAQVHGQTSPGDWDVLFRPAMGSR